MCAFTNVTFMLFAGLLVAVCFLSASLLHEWGAMGCRPATDSAPNCNARNGIRTATDAACVASHPRLIPALLCPLQEVCNFISKRLDDGKSVRDITTELLDDCIAVDPKEARGVGCDNMTIVLVLLKKP